MPPAGSKLPKTDRISRSMPTTRLLLLSNGHGEDLIARRILEPLQRLQPSLAIAVLPLVGQGSNYRQLEGVSAIGPRLTLPSGGFSNQSAGGLAQDLKAGLLSNTWKQWQSLQQWSHQGGRILAVGDLLPLAMAWASGLPYGFIGTPKAITPGAADRDQPGADGTTAAKAANGTLGMGLDARQPLPAGDLPRPAHRTGLRRHGVAPWPLAIQ